MSRKAGVTRVQLTGANYARLRMADVVAMVISLRGRNQRGESIGGSLEERGRLGMGVVAPFLQLTRRN